MDDFKGLSPEIQKSITAIIGQLREINPHKAKEAAERIGNFFRGISDSGKSITQVLENISGDLDG